MHPSDLVARDLSLLHISSKSHFKPTTKKTQVTRFLDSLNKQNSEVSLFVRVKKTKYPVWTSEKITLFGLVVKHGKQPSWTFRWPRSWTSSTCRERTTGIRHRWWTQSCPTLEKTVHSVDLLYNFPCVFAGYKKLPMLNDGDRRTRTFPHEDTVLQNYNEIHFLGDFSFDSNLSDNMDFSDFE